VGYFAMNLDQKTPPKAIQDAAKHGELVIFIGAGVSRLCGSPDWKQFSDGVVDQVTKLGALNFLESEQLRRLDDPRRTLSIAKHIARDAGISINYKKILHPDEVLLEGLELYRILKTMRPVFVTTNYDTWLDEPTPSDLAPMVIKDARSDVVVIPPKQPLYYRPDQFTTDRLTERGAVIHLHGSLQYPDSMIISLREYISHYGNEHVRTFLKHMFRNCTVLFMGYTGHRFRKGNSVCWLSLP
jgi:NAD-dependent SIR2 family protein deacetylase